MLPQAAWCWEVRLEWFKEITITAVFCRFARKHGALARADFACHCQGFRYDYKKGEFYHLKNLLQPKPYISFIVLTWNSESFLQGCFESIVHKCRDEGISFEVIAVDNGSRDRSTQIVKQFEINYANQFILISLGCNRGTTYPRNLGLKKAQGECICILDSDTELGEGCLSEILYRLGSDKRIGIIAPRLLLPDGAVQHSVKRFPTMLNKLMKVPRILSGFRTKNADFYDDFPFAEEREAETAISACWFFGRELLSTVGFLDEKIFYAPEDIDYSMRVWKTGSSILYYPRLTVLHHTQQITHRKPFSRTTRSHFWGLLYYYRKHGGWFIRPRFYKDVC
jgi:GT2 family glycosyltransferase